MLKQLVLSLALLVAQTEAFLGEFPSVWSPTFNSRLYLIVCILLGARHGVRLAARRAAPVMSAEVKLF
jgi:hypothetical protein